MKHLFAPLALCLALTPLWAQETAPETPPAEVDEGVDLMEEGAKLLLRGLLSEMEPALDEMGKAMEEMAPAIRELVEMMGDIRNYHAPELLPNGDIIIRRKTPTERFAPNGPQIDL